MLYGFGDVEQPREDTVELVEDYMMEFMKETLVKAANVSEKRGKIKSDDIMHVLRNDPKKYARIEELLYMNEELKNARKAFDVEGFDKPTE